MIKKEDIRRAISAFKVWDNEKRWDVPTGAFIQHTLTKSENALRTANYILRIMEDQAAKEFFDADDYDGTLWIINCSYYRIFFLAQYLLALDKRKLPQSTQDTHKTIELAYVLSWVGKYGLRHGVSEIVQFVR